MQRRLPEILEDLDNGLSHRFRTELNGLAEALRHLNERINHYDQRIEQMAQEDPQARALMTIWGISSKGATALLAAVGEDPGLFKNEVVWRYGWGWCHGNTPRAGETDYLASASEGTSAVLRYSDRKEALHSRWVTAMNTRRPSNVVVVALANKMARIAYAVLVTGRPYDPNMTDSTTAMTWEKTLPRRPICERSVAITEQSPPRAAKSEYHYDGMKGMSCIPDNLYLPVADVVETDTLLRTGMLANSIRVRGAYQRPHQVAGNMAATAPSAE